MADELLNTAGSIERLIADKSYDTNGPRALLAERGIRAVIPPSGRRTTLIPHDRVACRQRNLIESCSPASRTSVGSPPATTSSRETSSLAYSSPPL